MTKVNSVVYGQDIYQHKLIILTKLFLFVWDLLFMIPNYASFTCFKDGQNILQWKQNLKQNFWIYLEAIIIPRMHDTHLVDLKLEIHWGKLTVIPGRAHDLLTSWINPYWSTDSVDQEAMIFDVNKPWALPGITVNLPQCISGLRPACNIVGEVSVDGICTGSPQMGGA